MDIASSATGSDQMDSDQKRHGFISKGNSEHQNHKLKSASVENGSTEPWSPGSLNAESDKVITSVSDEENIRSKRGIVDMQHVTGKSSSRSSRKGKQVCPKSSGRRYLLRSARDGVRVLRSMSKEKSLTHTESVSVAVNPEKETRQKKRRLKKSSNDEFSRNRKQLRYLLARINYEQNLIDAYSGEGWKGQSLEKIRPEKELERAKSEILHRKLKIRNLFQRIDTSIFEGGIQETLFDNEGEICSEDIFCTKCDSMDLASDNDIILCDGSCNRGFHQKCLNPPLLSEDIPPGDEGWLCPACDCKVDCINLLNDLQGTKLSIEDRWEKVFPEAASAKNGDELYDTLSLPSDDSEDDDFDPDAPRVDVENQEERSSSGESDFVSSPEDSDPCSSGSVCHKHSDTLGLPSDDSEDDDYDPDGPDPDENILKECSSSDESEFSSDSDEFMGELIKASNANKASISPISDKKPLDHSSVGTCMNDRHKSSLNSELLCFVESDLNQENSLPVSEKRQRERLDYKKLHDETYGEVSSDSSDDDDWCNTSKSKKRKKDETVNESNLLLEAKARISVNKRTTGRSIGKSTEADEHQDSQFGTQTPSERTGHMLDLSSTINLIDSQPDDSLDPDSIEKKHNISDKKALDKMISQETYEEVCSDSSDDHDLCTINKSKKRNETENESNLLFEAKARISVNKRTTRRSMGKAPVANEVGNHDLDHLQDSQFATQDAPERTRQKFDLSCANNLIEAHPGDSFDPDTNGKKPSTSVGKTLDKMISQKLLESFKGNQYPGREIKANLAEEHGVTLTQVNKWFEKARRRARAAANKAAQLGLSTTVECTTATSSENHNQSYNGAGQNSTCNQEERGEPGQAKHSKVGADHNIGHGNAKKLVDNERQKAVARELRRMRNRR